MRRNDAAGIVAYVAFLLTAIAFASLLADQWRLALSLFIVDVIVCVAGGLAFGRGGWATRQGAPVREGIGASSPITRRAR